MRVDTFKCPDGQSTVFKLLPGAAAGYGRPFSGPDGRLVSPPMGRGRSSGSLQVAGCRRSTLGSRSAFFRVSHWPWMEVWARVDSLAAVNYGRRGRPRLDALKGGRRATTRRPPASYGGKMRGAVNMLPSKSVWLGAPRMTTRPRWGSWCSCGATGECGALHGQSLTLRPAWRRV